MKSECQLRKHLKHLRVTLERPCSCKGKATRNECNLSRLALAAAASMLEWVLGENPEYDAVEEETARIAGE